MGRRRGRDTQEGSTKYIGDVERDIGRGRERDIGRGREREGRGGTRMREAEKMVGKREAQQKREGEWEGGGKRRVFCCCNIRSKLSYGDWLLARHPQDKLIFQKTNRSL